MGDRHFNPRKAQALTAAVMGASTLAVGALATVAVEGASVASTLSVEHGFWVFMACITSGEPPMQRSNTAPTAAS